MSILYARVLALEWVMKHKLRIGGAVVGLAFLMSTSAALACDNPPQPELPRSPLIIDTAAGPQALSVEVASTDMQRSCGLMLRQRLGEREGMLFQYRQPRESYMWMANTPIPLDMLFVAANGRIVHIVKGAVPFSREVVGTSEPVSGVIEVRAGTADRLGIKLGDRVRHSSFGVGP